MQKFVTIFSVIISSFLWLSSESIAATDDFDFSSFTVTETGDADLTTSTVSINTGAQPITVNNFDIAGIMLGMSFDDVENLFLRGKGLYSPREKDSVIYSIQKDWKYNLDYECRQQGIFAP